GEKLLRAPPYARNEAQDAALRSGQPVTTGVFWAPLVNRYLIAVLVPVMVEGRHEFILTVGVPVDRFSEIINQAREVGRETVMEKMFGYRREELIGSQVETLIPEGLRAGHATLREGFANASAARAMGAGRDLFACRKDGSEFPVEIGLNPINTRAANLVMATV